MRWLVTSRRSAGQLGSLSELPSTAGLRPNTFSECSDIRKLVCLQCSILGPLKV